MLTILADSLNTAVFGARYNGGASRNKRQPTARSELDNELHRHPYAEFRHWPR